MELSKKPWPLITLCGIQQRIDTNPDFQRPAVWTTAQKQLLIDTIVQGLDIPKLYWQKTGSSPDRYAVIDGQQRLRAIWEFQAGQYALAKDSDPVDGCGIAGLKYAKLPDELRIRFDTYPLDVVIVQTNDDDEIRDMFLRLQNGTPLKAQEKRNAMGGAMRDYVKSLSCHKLFDSVTFKNSRYTYDLIAAQCVRLELAGQPCNIKNADLNRMYKDYREFDTNGPKAKKIKRVFDYLQKVFPSKTPELERFSLVSLYTLVSGLMDRFVIDGRHTDLSTWFVEFEQFRREDEQKSPEEREPELIVYHENISRSTDSEESIRKRNEVLSSRFFLRYTNFEQKDNQRDFTFEQRLAIFRRDKGMCQVKIACEGGKCDWDNWHADHKMPWSKGGKTVVENGHVACAPCNLKKGSHLT